MTVDEASTAPAGPDRRAGIALALRHPMTWTFAVPGIALMTHTAWGSGSAETALRSAVAGLVLLAVTAFIVHVAWLRARRARITAILMLWWIYGILFFFDLKMVNCLLVLATLAGSLVAAAATLGAFVWVALRFLTGDRDPRALAANAVAVSLCVLAVWPPSRAQVGAAFLLWRLEPGLTTMVESDQRPTGFAGRHDEHEPGVHRVAFVFGGVLDNWNGIAWDPSGRILEVNGHDINRLKDLPGDSPVHWFGGDLVGALHLWGAWYYIVAT